MSESTIFRWQKQDRIDGGTTPGVTTSDNAELRAARQRIAELEAELAATKRASELFAEGRVVRPKDIYPIVETLGIGGPRTEGVVSAVGRRIVGVLHVAVDGRRRRERSAGPG